MAIAGDVHKQMDDVGASWIDIKFVDVPGTWQHMSFPKEQVDETMFDHGVGFDGSSIRAFQSIDESDMLLVPDPSTLAKDPFIPNTMSVIADVRDPITMEDYKRSPRYVAKHAEEYLKSTGIGDVSYWGPEAEFFIFDSVSYGGTANSAHYEVDSEEAVWNMGNASDITGDGPNLGHKIRHKHGYFPAPPVDTQTAIRSEACEYMANFGIEVERHHHEVATAGQGEINFRYGPLVKTADRVMAYKYCVKNTALKHGKTATFMPKPLFEDNGSGMHTHLSFWKDGTPLFAGDQYAGLSDMALYFTGGLLKHINSLLAFCAPLTNSYRRLVPGYEAPVVVAYSARNRSAACRIPMYSQSPNSKRIEFRCPDPGANPYLAFAAMVMAGMDGIKNQIDPGDPAEIDLYEEDVLKEVEMVKGSLGEVLDALEEDNDYLLEGGVFTPDLLDAYIEYKRLEEVDAVRLRPHPQEFVMYYGI
jgi:glutamine synthetase